MDEFGARVIIGGCATNVSVKLLEGVVVKRRAAYYVGFGVRLGYESLECTTGGITRVGHRSRMGTEFTRDGSQEGIMTMMMVVMNKEK